MKRRYIVLIVLLLIISFFVFNYKVGNSYSISSSDITINNPKQTNQTLRVLAIEINPVLNTVKNKPKVSDYFNQSYDIAVNELIEDIEDMSHGYINIQINHEYLNEFPTYKEKITLANGTKSNRLDEETFLKEANNGWYDYVVKSKYITDLYQNHNYIFDYDYIINKYNLIERRNKNEFDQVWLVGIDPTLSYETIMVGNNPYWINAPGYKANCSNFQIAGASMSRRDAQLHALEHGVEGIMNAVFHSSFQEYSDYTNKSTYYYYNLKYDSYKKDTININSLTEYNKLNLWEKFILGTYNNSFTFSSVGNVHFPFNGESDYDYENKNNVYTNWREWLDYPNINGNFQLDNSSAWLNHEINNKLGQNEDKSPCRLYSRFWFYLMPHVDGYTSDGYLNNWWKYFYSLDYVTDIKNNGSLNINTNKNEYVKVNFDLIYNSLKKNNITLINEGNNIQIENNNVLGYKNGYLYGKNKGKSNVTINYDGLNITYLVNVLDLAKKEKKEITINFDKNSAFGVSKDSLKCTLNNDSCSIIMPTIILNDDEISLGFSSNKDAINGEYLENKEYKFTKNITLYAITKKEIKENLEKGITIYVKDLANTCLNNVKLSIKDKQSNILDTWNYDCNNKTHLINLKDGEYILEEKRINNYATIPNRTINVKNNKVEKVITFINYPITVCFINSDTLNHEIEIYDNMNKFISKLELDNEKKCLTNLDIGDYKLKDANNKSEFNLIHVKDTLIEQEFILEENKTKDVNYLKIIMIILAIIIFILIIFCLHKKIFNKNKVNNY